MSYLKNKLNKIKKFFNKELIIYSNIISEDTIIATIPFKKIGDFTFNDISDCLIKKGMKDFNYYTEINKVKQIVPSTSDIHLSNITSGNIIVLNMYLSLVERIGYFKNIKNKNENNRNFKKYINNLSETIQHKEINKNLESLITKLQKANQEGNYEKFKKELIENYEKNKKIIESNNNTNSETVSSNMSIPSSNNKNKSQTVNSNMSMTNSNMSMTNSNFNNINTSKNIKPSITISPQNPVTVISTPLQIIPNSLHAFTPNYKDNSVIANSNAKSNLGKQSPILKNILTNKKKIGPNNFKSKTNFKKGDTVYWYANKLQKYKYGTLGNEIKMNGKNKYKIIDARFLNGNNGKTNLSFISKNKLMNKKNISLNPNSIPENHKSKSKTNFKKGDKVYWYSNLQKIYKYGILGNKIMSKNGKIKYHINNPKYYNNNTSIAGQQTPISENKLINRNNIKINK